MKIDPIHPSGWKQAKGYNHGVLVEGGDRLLFVAGQIAWDAEQRLVGPGDFPAQFRQALSNVVEVVRAAGGLPEHIARMNLYVTDKRLYLDNLAEIGAAYRDLMGRHYPAMALVQVADLLEDGALVEIEATAAFEA
jgi:enamine deaminase RidA (YjgF/YER057c/UK114 family)